MGFYTKRLRKTLLSLPQSLFFKKNGPKVRYASGSCVWHLLLIFQKAREVVEIHDFLLIAVGDHYQVEVSARGNHLVERAEFFEAQRALVLICICILEITRKRL